MQHTDETTEESVLDNTQEMENTAISPMYGGGRRKLIRDTSITTTPTPGMEVDAKPTTKDNPNVVTVVDQNDITDSIKTENIELTDNQNEQHTRKSTRLRSTNPINRYRNTITFCLLQVTPLTNGARTTTSRKGKMQRPDEKKRNGEEKSSKRRRRRL